jgi:hypothetical protein
VADRKINIIVTAIDKATGPLGVIQSGLGGLGRAAGGLATAGLAAATAGVAALGVGLTQVVRLGSDAEEAAAKFGVVFANTGSQVSTAVDQFARSVGRSKFELREMAATFGDTFKPMGFTEQAAADLSVQMSRLAVDLGSFNNMPTDEALRRLQGTLIGSHENALAFGVVITENTLKAELAANGWDKLTGAALEQAKVQARVNLLMRGTTDAQGDAERTASGWANTSRRLMSILTDTGTTIGTKLLPTITPLLAQFTDMAERVAPLLGDKLASMANTGIQLVIDSFKTWQEAFAGDWIDAGSEKINGLHRVVGNVATVVGDLSRGLDTFIALTRDGATPATALKEALADLVPPEVMQVVTPLVDGIANLADKMRSAWQAVSIFKMMVENGVEPAAALKGVLSSFVGRETADNLVNAAVGIKDFVGGIISFVEQNPREIEGVLLGIGTALGILGLHSAVTTMMSLLAAGLAAVSVAGGATTIVMGALAVPLGVVTGLLTALASPIVLLALLVGALAAAWYTNFGNIRGNTMLIANILKHYFEVTIPNAMETLKQAAFILKVKWGEFWEAIGSRLNKIWLEVIQPIIARITGAINGALAGLEKLSGANLTGSNDKNASGLSKPGANARGTSFWRGGLTWVDEEGPELVNLPTGTQINNAQTSRQMAGQMGSGGGVTIQNTFYVNSEMDLQVVAAEVTRIQKENA